MTHSDRRERSIGPRNRPRVKYLILIALSLLPLRAQSQAPENPGPANTFEHIDQSLAHRLETMDWGDGRVGILVEDAGHPLTAYVYSDSTLMKPGSLMKIVTTAAALEQLGENFRFSTRLCITGEIEGHTLKGALVVQGGGDPSFPIYDPDNPEQGWAVFDRWASLLRERGIRKIEGPIIGDDRIYDDRTVGAGWPAGHLGDPNIPMISGLNFNTNCVSIYWKTGRWVKRIASYSMFPAIKDYIFFSNNLRITETVHQPREFSRVQDGNLITVSGQIEPNSQAFDRVSIDDPTTFFVKALKIRLEQKKIKVEGEAQSIADYDGEVNVSDDMKFIDEQISPPLKTLLKGMLANDSTLTAECLFKALGRQPDASGVGSFENGAQAVNGYFDDLRLPGANRIIIDGSGLSSIDRLSPAHLVNLLRRVEGRPRTKAIADLFPKAWEKGVLENRFRPTGTDSTEGAPSEEGSEDSMKAPPVQAIVASSEGIEGMAGWVTNRVGRRLLFAIMVDGSKAPFFQLRKQIDLLVLEIANSGSGI